MKDRKVAEDMKLEVGLQKLQEIVKKLEANDCELEQALELFEQGVGFARACHKKLDDAEKKIEILTKVQENGIESKPFKADGI